PPALDRGQVAPGPPRPHVGQDLVQPVVAALAGPDPLHVHLALGGDLRQAERGERRVQAQDPVTAAHGWEVWSAGATYLPWSGSHTWPGRQPCSRRQAHSTRPTSATA